MPRPTDNKTMLYILASVALWCGALFALFDAVKERRSAAPALPFIAGALLLHGGVHAARGEVERLHRQEVIDTLPLKSILRPGTGPFAIGSTEERGAGVVTLAKRDGRNAVLICHRVEITVGEKGCKPLLVFARDSLVLPSRDGGRAASLLLNRSPGYPETRRLILILPEDFRTVAVRIDTVQGRVRIRMTD